MNTTVSDLASFDRTGYDAAARACSSKASAVLNCADDLQAQADALRIAYRSPAAQLAAAQLETTSQQTSSQSGHLTQAGRTIRQVGRHLDSRQEEVENAQQAVSQYPMALAEDGRVTVTSAASTWPHQRPLWVAIARSMTLSVRQILFASDAELLAGENALRWLQGEELHTAQSGPIDMDTESLLLAAETNSQGGYGDCVSLAILTGIARSDPAFIQEHMVWDADAGVYHVTLYDTDGNPVVVDVDPDQVPTNGASAYRDVAPTFMTIYEEAISQYDEGLMDGAAHPHAAQVITGNSVGRHPATFEEIQETLSSEPAGVVIVGTSGAQSEQPRDISPDLRTVRLPNGDQHATHAYTVQGFDEQGRIVLTNPWGPQGGFHDGRWYPGELHLTQEEFEQWFHTATRIEQPL